MSEPVKPAPLASFTARQLVRELRGRKVLSQEEADWLNEGGKLAAFYATPEHEVDQTDLDEAEARLGRGDLVEALVWIGRAVPALAELPHLFARTKWAEAR